MQICDRIRPVSELVDNGDSPVPLCRHCRDTLRYSPPNVELSLTRQPNVLKGSCSYFSSLFIKLLVSILIHAQGRMKTKLGQMLLPSKGLFSSHSRQTNYRKKSRPHRMGLMLQHQSYPAESGSAQLYSFRVVTVINHEVHMMVTPYDDQIISFCRRPNTTNRRKHAFIFNKTLIVQKTESITSDGSCRPKCRVQHHIYADTVKGKQKVKADIALHGNPITPSQSYGTSLAIWDHTLLPATRHKLTRPA